MIFISASWTDCSHSTLKIHRETLNSCLKMKTKQNQKMIERLTSFSALSISLCHPLSPLPTLLALSLWDRLALCYHIGFVQFFIPWDKIFGQFYLGPQISSIICEICLLKYEYIRLFPENQLDFIKIWRTVLLKP